MKFPRVLKGGLLLALLIALTTASFQVFTNTVFDPELAMEDEMSVASELTIEDEQLMNDSHNDLILHEGELGDFEITYNDDISLAQDSLTIRTTAPPPQPVFANSSVDRVTVQVIPAPEGWVTQYRIRDVTRPWGLRWQTSNSFDRLTEGVAYQVQARFVARNTATHADSDESVASENITTTNDIFLRPRPDLPSHTEVRAHVSEGVGGRAFITATNTADVPLTLFLGSISAGNPDPVLFDAAGNRIAFRNRTNLPPALNPMNFWYSTTLNPGQVWNGYVGTDGDVDARNSFIHVSVSWIGVPGHSTPTPMPSTTPGTPTPMPSTTPRTPTPVPSTTPRTPTPIPSTTPRTPTPIPSTTPRTPTPIPCPIDRLTTDPPSQPVLNYMLIRRLTVHPITAPSGWATEYRIRAINGSWGPWQDSNSFSGSVLIRGTVYQVQARFRAINQDTHADSSESEASADLTFTPGVDPPPQPVVVDTRFPNMFVRPIPAPDGWRTQYRLRNVNSSWESGSGWKWNPSFTRFDGLTPGEVYQVQARFMENPIVNYVFTNESESSIYVTLSPDRTTATRTGNTVTVNPITAPNGWTIEYRIAVGRTPFAWSEWQTGTSFEVDARVTFHHVIEARFVADNEATHQTTCVNMVAIAMHR